VWYVCSVSKEEVVSSIGEKKEEWRQDSMVKQAGGHSHERRQTV